ncbi:MAG: hypothetical protein WBB24_01525 [Maribacter sp.]
MRKLSVLAFLVFFILFGCTKDSPDTTETDSDENTEEPEVLTNEVYFTLKIPEDYFTSEFEGWVIAHDHDGQILNYRKLENNSSFSFEKPKLKYKYSQEITLLTVFKNNGNTYHNLNTYTFVQDSAIWELTKETISDYSSERGQEIGKFTMNVIDLISPAIYKITNKNGTPSFLSGSTTFNNGSTNIFFDEIPLYEENNYLFSLYDSSGTPSYMLLENLTDGTNITFNQSQMRFFDNTVSLGIPEGGEYFLSVLGYEADQQLNESNGYVLSLILPFDRDKISSNQIEVGYLNRFENYITTFNYSNDKFYYSYKKFGEAPTHFGLGNLERWNLEIMNESITDFQFNGPSQNLYNRKQHSWNTSSGIRDVEYSQTVWTVYKGIDDYHKIGEIPEEILNSYPNLDIKNINYGSSTFYLDELTYQEFLDASFVQPNTNKLRNHESIRIVK